MANFVRYHAKAKSYSFAFMNDDQLTDMTKDDQIEYYKQQALWSYDDNQEALEKLCDEAKKEYFERNPSEVV